jgi:hypothetical protein
MNWKYSLYFIIIASILSCKPSMDESTNIKKLIEKESATWRSGDSKAHASCWHIQPYSKILISTADGTTIDVPPNKMIEISENTLAPGGSSENTNYKISINKKTAWVSHDEVSTAKDGKKTYSYEIRLLEKIDKEWKLVGQSIHAYKTK